MKRINIIFKKILLAIVICSLGIFSLSYAEENVGVLKDQIKVLSKDLKTLERAVYEKSNIVKKSASRDGLNEDVLTKHLLKLNEIENQFRELTNRFEEINFKMDKLSNRVTKIQSDNQLRFNDLEAQSGNNDKKSVSKNKKKLPGTEKPQDFGAAQAYNTESLPKEQRVNSIETAATVVTEKPELTTSLLPDKSPKEQYEFAISLMKIGDYETAEFALKEFIDKNKDHDLAGNAQYWYGETFRIRQLYSDAASAYLDGYQNYPKSKKAPDNLLKLGITMVQLGEKDQGCKMISGIKKEYPKASKSVLQKAQYEQKKFKCKS